LYLKNITLRGFKSFAKKSQLLFEPGISVIVGPNGSGKSNIADALSWVLGMQSPKSLRASSMDDVIFRSRNEELGIAEVSLLFDNKDKFLPVDFAEVKLTRRVFQKGGSEYFINSTPARLTDILDLTSEQGIGKGLYTIVNQGQIDELAVLKPLDRKFIVDEILGISKHKTRRAKSKSKLAKVSTDIERVSDLMLEVKRTLDPLELASRRAQKYFEVLNELKESEMSLFISEFNDLNSSWNNESTNYENKKKEIVKYADDISDLYTEKNRHEESFSKKQGLFAELKVRIEYFNELNSRLDNTSAITGSKIRVFNMLSAMFENQYDSIKSTTSEIKFEKTKRNEFEDNKLLAYEKLLVLKNSFDDLLLKIKTIPGTAEILHEAEKYYRHLEETVDYFRQILGANAASNEEAVNSDSIKKDFLNSQEINNFETGIEKSLENIKLLQQYCIKKTGESEKFFSILSSLKNLSGNLKKILLLQFDKLLKEINDYNTQESNLLSKINELNLKKQAIENEIYRADLHREQIKEKVKNISEEIIENYNLTLDYIFKNYEPAKDVEKSKKIVKKLKSELKSYGSINPNATTEYKIIKERYDFLDIQYKDLIESKKKLEELILEINSRIEEMFTSKFDAINKNFGNYFKALFPLGTGEMILLKIESEGEKDYGIDLKVDIGNNKMVPLSLLSGGEKALVSIAFLFSIFSINYSPFYVFDEIDAALDDMNLNRFVTLVKKFSASRQVIIITHQKKTMEIADTIYGITMQSTGMSKIVSEKNLKKNAEIN
jgi:chromosome segregation protein